MYPLDGLTLHTEPHQAHMQYSDCSVQMQPRERAAAETLLRTVVLGYLHRAGSTSIPGRAAVSSLCRSVGLNGTPVAQKPQAAAGA
jgi:hypothetical protein